MDAESAGAVHKGGKGTGPRGDPVSGGPPPPLAPPDLDCALAEGLLDPLEGISEPHRGEPGKRRAQPDRKLPLGRLIVETDAPVDHEPGGAAQAESESRPRGAGERREGVGAGDIGGEGGGSGEAIGEFERAVGAHRRGFYRAGEAKPRRGEALARVEEEIRSEEHTSEL